MWTRRQMVELAAREQLGADASLSVAFDNWRKIGLLPPPVQKELRRGGAGLWPEPVVHVWIGMLRNRRRGCRVSTLANFPVLCWLVHWPGFADVTSPQRAMRYWGHVGRKGERATGERSLRDRIIWQVVEDLAHPEAPLRAKRILRNGVQVLADGIAATATSASAAVVRAVAEVHPAGTDPDAIREAAEGLHQQIRMQLYAARYLPVLVSERRQDVAAYWEWARRYAIGEVYPRAEPDPPVTVWAERSTDEREAFRHAMERDANVACRNLMFVFGVGLRVLAGGEWGPTWETPPALRGVHPPADWGEPDPLFHMIDRWKQ